MSAEFFFGNEFGSPDFPFPAELPFPKESAESNRTSGASLPFPLPLPKGEPTKPVIVSTGLSFRLTKFPERMLLLKGQY